MNKKRILIVDDSADDIHVLMENLKQEYAVIAATSGNKAIELARKSPPEVILMDVEMPDMGGYETCRQIKSDPEMDSIDVIFVTAHDSKEASLAGYDAGGSDYLIKPVDTEILKQKIAITIKNREILKSLESSKLHATKIAMTAMTSGSELGIILDCLRKSFAVNSIDQLGGLIITAVSAYDLNSTVQIRSNNGTFCYSNNGVTPPIENELLTRIKDDGRILQFNARLILNYGNISLLVKKLPVNDAELVGRLRDHLAILLEGMDSKLASIELHMLNESRKQALQNLVAESSQTLQDFHAEKVRSDNLGLAVVNELLHDLEATFIRWGLTESQEEKLLEMVKVGIKKYETNYEIHSRTEDRLKEIIDTLKRYSN